MVNYRLLGVYMDSASILSAVVYIARRFGILLKSRKL